MKHNALTLLYNKKCEKNFVRRLRWDLSIIMLIPLISKHGKLNAPHLIMTAQIAIKIKQK